MSQAARGRTGRVSRVLVRHAFPCGRSPKALGSAFCTVMLHVALAHAAHTHDHSWLGVWQGAGARVKIHTCT